MKGEKERGHKPDGNYETLADLDSGIEVTHSFVSVAVSVTDKQPTGGQWTRVVSRQTNGC